MYLAAIYIENHFLFEGPQTINFGGKYYYNFTEGNKINRIRNKNYIKGFYSYENIHLISAIVGSNGVGKTTLMRTIIDCLKDRFYGVKCIYIIESEDDTFSNAYSSQSVDFIIKHLDINKIETIYYSPFLDFKEELTGIDLSYDAVIHDDLSQSNEKYVANNSIDYTNWLKSKNSLRQLEFQFSKYGKQLQKFFNFPEFQKGKFTFVRHKIDVDNDIIQFHNTPLHFQSYLQKLYKLILEEAKNINSYRPEGFSLVELQKKLFKNYIIMDMFCLLLKQMEKSNKFLEEGNLSIEYKDIDIELEGLSSIDALFKFLDAHSFNTSNNDKLLPIDETKEFINYLFNIIDNLEAKDDNDTRFFNWNTKSIYVDISVCRNIIEKHRDFLIIINQYYGKIEDERGNLLFKKNERIAGIINFEPSQGSLSSGENALLNFYSRIYDYFTQNSTYLPSIEIKKNYILVLDEADLGFHPKWKKKYINSISEFLGSFFKSFDAGIHIIFTTHDPLTLSDIPNENIVYLDKINESTLVLTGVNRPKKSFGANITDLLADSFFVDDGLIGDFAKEKIKNTVNWLRNSERDNSLNDYYKSIIKIIDEPIIKGKLSELYDEVFETNLKLSQIQEQIELLEKQKQKLIQ